MKITVKAVEKATGMRAQAWKGNCYSMACKMVESGLVKGRAVYGHWLGPVHPKSMFARRARAPFVRHGWIVKKDGTVVDPTRWVFEHVRPYVFCGSPGSDYDEGGNALRRIMMRDPPRFDPSERRHEITSSVLASEPWAHVERVLHLDMSKQEPGLLTDSQLSWLANAPPEVLDGHARAIYQALEKLGRRALVPIDNWIREMGE